MTCQSDTRKLTWTSELLELKSVVISETAVTQLNTSSEFHENVWPHGVTVSIESPKVDVSVLLTRSLPRTRQPWTILPVANKFPGKVRKEM
jgi:hypothetical protein